VRRGDPDQFSLPAAAGERVSELACRPCLKEEKTFHCYARAVAVGLAVGAVGVGEPVPYGPGDGEVAGVTLLAGKTPAPESDPGEA
jgi:hypothetical protein